MRNMGSLSFLDGELSLNNKPSFEHKNLKFSVLEQVMSIENLSARSKIIDEVITSLEDEMMKINGFKCVLPQCMTLLQDAIKILKEDKRGCAVSDNIKFLGTPLTAAPNEDVNILDKKDWLKSAQLWNNNCSSSVEVEAVKQKDVRGGVRDFKPFDGFMGFDSGKKNLMVARNHDQGDKFMQGVSIGARGNMIRRPDSTSYFLYGKTVSAPYTLPSMTSNSYTAELEMKRKPRRSWDENLHRLFERALEHLGGSMVATPKAIKDFMNIDGLTNDEVKSHLQKHRHRIGKKSREGKLPTNPVLESGTSISKISNFSTESPQGPLQSRGGVSTTGGDSMEGDDDGRSESSKPEKNDN